MMKHLPQLAFLDHLRPPAGWRTDSAVFSTYSAHTSVIAATLLALSGRDDEEGSGTRIGLARSLRELRGKVHIILQRGRLTCPALPSPIVALMDRFIIQVPWDEGSSGIYKGKSWHAKFALVRQVPESNIGSGERWVFMLGSRNMTLDTSWDMGLVLQADATAPLANDHQRTVIPGIAALAKSLGQVFPAELGRWTHFGSTALDTARWNVPSGCQVTEIQLLLPDQVRELPLPPSEVSEVLAVSPFLDSEAVSIISRWGNESTERRLLSTHSALAKLASQQGHALSRYKQLLVLPETIITNDPIHETAMENEAHAADHHGLHAKFIHVRHQTGHALWLGSPNLTQRAWTRNAECFARIDLAEHGAGTEILKGVSTFMEMADSIDLRTLAASPADTDVSVILAQTRMLVSARLEDAYQAYDANGDISIRCSRPPLPEKSDIRLSCSPLTLSLQEWPSDSVSMVFPQTRHLVECSDFIRLRLELEGEAVEWLQVVNWSPRLPDKRDDAVLADYLGSSQMLAWISEILRGYSTDEGGSWDSRPDSARSRSHSVEVQELPTIEQALRLWLRHRAKLDEIDRVISMFEKRTSSGVSSPDMDKHLLEFSSSWSVMRKGLVAYDRKDGS